MLSLMWKMMRSRGGSKNAMLDTMLSLHDAKLFNLDDRVPPPEYADRRNTFTSTIPDDQLSVGNMTYEQRIRTMPTMFRLMQQMNASARYYEKPLPEPRTEASPEFFERLEEIATEEGATAIRYVTLSDDCIFGGLGVPYRNTIVYTVQMDRGAMDTAPSFECFHEVVRGYLRLARIGNRLAEFLRSQGFAGFPGTALGGLSDYARVAELAGLGSIGYHGCLITPQDGALLRLNTIYTSIKELPHRDPEPTEWIRDFCSVCRKCIRECPPEAIHPIPLLQDNGRVQCIETTTCLDYFAAHHGCAVCIDVCPFTQSGYDAIREGFKGNADAPRFDITRPPEHARS